MANTIKIDEKDYQWLVKKSEETQISIKSIVGLGLDYIKGKADSKITKYLKEKSK